MVDPSPTELKPGVKIGPYMLRERLAEGGMGVVYVAEQSQPVRRKVALKVVKPGLSTKEIVARFDAERQALAMMDHPHIARVIDGGATDSGQPYFVMELVQGLPLNKYCDAKRLNTVQRLALFVKICRAVQHAHQKGIIHRDLKPSNVLVAEVDGEALPKVIDFGIAKAVNQKLSDETVYTQFSQLVGTPMYMSPEQVGFGVIDIDTRSDVYSLGVMLYELLTGSQPFDSEALKRSGFDAMRQIIREQEPLRPSRQLSTLKADEISTVAERRACDPRKLCSHLKGDLDWVCVKALVKDRDHRYSSPAELADDLERFLSGYPVLAGRPSTAYRAKKYLRRHKLALTAAAVVVFSMVLGTSFSVRYAIQARAAQKAAEASEALASRRLTLLQKEQSALRAEQQKLKDRAIYHARKAVELSPDNPNAWFCLAWVYVNAVGNGEEAAKAMRRSAHLAVNPFFKQVRLGKSCSWTGAAFAPGAHAR